MLLSMLILVGVELLSDLSGAEPCTLEEPHCLCKFWPQHLLWLMPFISVLLFLEWKSNNALVSDLMCCLKQSHAVIAFTFGDVDIKISFPIRLLSQITVLTPK